MRKLIIPQIHHTHRHTNDRDTAWGRQASSGWLLFFALLCFLPSDKERQHKQHLADFGLPVKETPRKKVTTPRSHT